MNLSEKRLRAIGHAIGAERQRQGLSQSQLATMIGLTNHSYLSRVESGQKPPSLQMVFDIADALDVEVKYFFTEI